MMNQDNVTQYSLDDFKKAFENDNDFHKKVVTIYNQLRHLYPKELFEFLKDKINTKDAYGRTLLYMAVELKDEDLVEHLLENYQNIDVNTQKNTGCSIFRLAYSTKEPNETILRLIAEKVDINQQDIGSKYTALHKVLNRDYIKSAKILLENPKINVNLRANNGDCPIYFLLRSSIPEDIALKDFKELISLMIQRGANLNELDHKGRHIKDLLLTVDYYKPKLEPFVEALEHGISILKQQHDSDKSQYIEHVESFIKSINHHHHSKEESPAAINTPNFRNNINSQKTPSLII